MKLDTTARRPLVSWLFIGALTALAATFAVVQYRWIGDLSRAERDRLNAGLRNSLERLRQDLDSEITGAAAAIVAGPLLGEPADRERGYAANYARWHGSTQHTDLFRAVYLAVPREDELALREFDPASGRFRDVAWPQDWGAMRDAMAARLERDGPPRGPFAPAEYLATTFEVPIFGPDGGPGSELEWLVFDLNTAHLRSALLPDLVERHLGGSGGLEFDVEVQTPALLYRSAGALAGTGDASIRLFDPRFDTVLRRAGRFGPRPMLRRRGGPGGGMGGPPDRGRWLLRARHRAGSLEAVVARGRMRNLAFIAGVLGLMGTAAAALVSYTRRAQRLADAQMQFVAGVSHELRTPLTVMRTAGHNLQGALASDPARVRRYGMVIEQQSTQLTTIVEQILRFANANAGRAIGAVAAVPLAVLIDEVLESEQRRISDAGCAVEKCIAPDLPQVTADAATLRHALQNLLDNALKHGAGGPIRIEARALACDAATVEVRIRDSGPGIPADELPYIFDAFFRGRRAVEDQVHGTGLGLSLARKIIEAHGGKISATSGPGRGTEFVITLPAADQPNTNELTDLTHRG